MSRNSNNNGRANNKGRGISLWFKNRRNTGASTSTRSINDSASAADILLRSSSRSVGARSTTSESHSKKKLDKIIGGIKAVEKTHKELAKIPKVVTPWQNFVEEEYFIKFGGKWPDTFPARTPNPLEFQMKPRTPRGNPASWSIIQEAEVKTPMPCENPDELPTKWHRVITERDWNSVGTMLAAVQKESVPPKGQETNTANEDITDANKMSPDDAGTDDVLAPLSQTDSSDYTPMHLACAEKMPSKLTQQLFSLNKDVAILKDNQGRLPLHLAALYRNSAGVLDRLVRSNPDTIAVADSHGRSPLRYALLEAERRRDKSLIGMDWKYPVTRRQSRWQTTQVANWSNVELLLKSMIRRKKLLYHASDQALVLESVQCFAPPDVVIYMLTVGIKVIANETTSVILFSLLFRFNYPIKVFEVALQMCIRTMPIPKLVDLFQQGLVRHFDEGCMEIYREMSETKLSYRDELLEGGGVAAWDDDACKDWWDRLMFFLTVSTYQGLTYDEDLGIPQDQLVHSALSIPEIASSLVDFFLRLTPDCGLQPDIKNGALPIHLACKNTKNKSIGKRLQIFKCALEGGSNLRRKEYRGRLPLHLALVADQPLPVLQTILALDTQTAGRRDPMTRLFPFQLAVLSHPLNGSREEGEGKEDGNDSKPSGDVVWSKLDASYELLRACPIAVLPQMYMGTGNLKADINPITLHVVNWCYEYSQDKEWVPCEYRIQQLKELLSSKDTEIADEDLQQRWTKTKQLIWQLYKIRSAKQKNKLKLGDDKFLLHAALKNGLTPPLLIAIILQQQESSVHKALSGNTWYPVHLAARSPSYTPLPFETSCIELPATTALGLVANATKPENLRTLSGGKTPLELALTTGKTWDDIEALVKLHPESLLHPESKSGHYPFQHVASKQSSPSAHKIVRSRSLLEKWNTDPSSGAENAAKIKGYRKAYQLEKLTTVFEILRAKPAAILAAARGISFKMET
ncbi:unnamed protein product [Cylindrotheca closterium]|uniref:Uncharacterized protein n=1 Tax=Cylindrotheca closterium TaxID=2856 RepID=A0AAD2JLT7_9STRA|nr:unnamed protein product [Cylindrotheca closterium]